MSTENTGRRGVNAVEAIFLEMGWIFREQPISDYGIDAQVEIVGGDGPTGQLIALQIKSGSSYFRRKRNDSYLFRGNLRHLAYWDHHSLPVLLILYNPETQLTVWTKIERYLVTIDKDGWSIEIPSYRKLTAESANDIAASIPRTDPESVRRQRMSLDLQSIEEISKRGEAYVTIDEWVNKSLNFRSASIFYDDPDAAKPDYSIDFYYPAHSITEIMDALFPWLSYTYHCALEECGGGEVVVHTLVVQVNEIGRAFLTMEAFYHDGPPESSCPEPPCSPDSDDMFWEDHTFQDET